MKEAVLRSVFIYVKVFRMAVKDDWRVFVFVKFCAKIYHGVFVAMTEGTGGATSAAVVQKKSSGKGDVNIIIIYVSTSW